MAISGELDGAIYDLKSHKPNKKDISKSEAEKILKEAHNHDHDHENEKKDLMTKSEPKTVTEKKPSTKTAKSKPAAKKTKKVSKK